MIEIPAQRRSGNALPTAGVVARFARLGEAALVRIGVAIGTFAEGQSLEPRLTVRTRSVTLLALDLCVQSSQRKLRFGVVKLTRSVFPIGAVVALCAVISKPSVMRVLVASRACRTQPQIGLAQVAYFDGLLLRRRNFFRRVAAVAGKSRVFAFEREPSLLVIKTL